MPIQGFGKFNKRFYFHWEDFNNEWINDWNRIAETLLSIPMAHQLIGWYTVADDTDSTLKVMRSYQYWAASKISDKVSKMRNDWNGNHLLGGYIWHTTGSGKTMTSFKSAQLIANSGDSDKVIFLMDRIELGTQSLLEFRGFADEDEEIQATKNTSKLIQKVLSDDSTDTLIVTSIQKMSRIKEDSKILPKDLEKMNSKRIVFIVDECHRSTFGDMLATIKETFPNATFFGFTGTPILDEHSKKDNTTASVFGDELHRYSISDGIRDGNVLGFDTYKVLTFKDNDVRKAVALDMAKAKNVEEIFSDSNKKEIYNKYMYDLPMVGFTDDEGNYIKGVEDYLPTEQYETDSHRKAVVNDIIDNWNQLSRYREFSAIFATSSIKEAIIYYRMIKEKCKTEDIELNFTGLFDPSIDNTGGIDFKEDGLVELIDDYNKKFNFNYNIASYDKLKKDISLRLAKKKQYRFVKKEEQLDLLIVVDQMLTGYDSKYINTLYLDKVLKYENIIQAMSRTNRIYNEDKKFGTIKWYRRPYLMEKNINLAVKLYSGDTPYGVFVQKLNKNIEKINVIYNEIIDVFRGSGIDNFERLPSDKPARAKFAELFKSLVSTIESSRIQGFNWKKQDYLIDSKKYHVNITENMFNILMIRYKELSRGDSLSNDEIPYELDSYITTIESNKIDKDYMNSKFEKYLKVLEQPNVSKKELEQKLNDLHKSFAFLTQEEQKYANIFLRDIESGQIIIDKDKTFRDYITEYEDKEKNEEISKISDALGLDKSKLKEYLKLGLNSKTINEYNRLNELKNTVDRAKARDFFENKMKCKLRPPDVSIKLDELLRNFILLGGFDIDKYFNSSTNLDEDITYDNKFFEEKLKAAEDIENYNNSTDIFSSNVGKFKTNVGRNIYYYGEEFGNMVAKNKLFNGINTLNDLFGILLKSWSKETAYPSSARDKSFNIDKDPTYGQCTITSMLVYDMFGGTIHKVRLNGGTHYFNKIDGHYIDLTRDQFDLYNIPLEYEPNEELARYNVGTTQNTHERFELLKFNILKNLNK